MNPFSTYNTIPWECFRVGYNFLSWYDADYKPVPDLADPVPTIENGGVTDGGRVWTFHIRPNVKWSDGEPLTARDVAFTYNLIRRQKLSMYLSYFTGVTKVEAPDDATVVITSAKPNAVMTALYVPYPPGARLEQGARPPSLNRTPTCRWSRAAPSRSPRSRMASSCRMDRNPYYKDGFGVEPTIERGPLRDVPDAGQPGGRLQSRQSGRRHRA